MGKFFKGLLIAALLLQLSFIFIQPASADQGKTESQNEYWPSRLRFSAGGGGGDGARGIFYIDELLPLFYTKDKATLWFLNTKQNWQTPNSQEYNMGTGIRHIFNDKFIVGLHYFFDKKYSKNKIWHDQNGVGLEFLSQPLDFRFNWYDPTKKGANGSTIVSNYYKFGPMELLQIGPREEALGGFDFEFGTPVFEKQTKTRFYLGGFFFNSKIAKDVNGIRMRTETNLNKWLAFDTTFNHWGSGKNEVIGGFRVTVPFELGRVKEKGNPFNVNEMDYIHDRLFERVVRDIDVKTNTSGIGDVQEKVPGIDIIYADNSNTTGTEDGTLAHPYSAISGAFGDPRFVGNGGNARYIYVFNGDGTSGGYSDGYTLPESGVLWGSGYNGGYNGLPTPGFPLLESGGILLDGNNTTVMGLQLQNIGGDAIHGNSISSVNITSNIITNNSGNGIYLENYGPNSSWNISGNTIDNNSNTGIYLYSGADSIDAPILSNVNISGNEITRNSTGIYVESYIPLSNVNISGNNISNNRGSDSGIDFYNYDVASNVAITGNTINGNNGPGIYLENYGEALNFNISGNTISNNNSVRSGLDIYNYGGTAENFNILNNSIIENGGDGIYLYNSGRGSTFTLFGPLQPDGIDELPPGMRNFNISGNNITGNSGYGIHIDNGGDDAVEEAFGFGLLQADGESELLPLGDMDNFNITRNNLSGNSGAGLYIENHGGGFDGIETLSALRSDYEYTGGMTNFNISDNSIMDNTSSLCGIDIYNDGFMEDFTISNNTISRNSGAGIDIDNNWGPFHNLTISDNTISGNTGSGIYIGNFDDMGDVIISGNTISDNSMAPTCGIDVFSEEAETHDFSFTNNTITGNSGAGIDIISQWSDVWGFNFSRNKISGNSGPGIAITGFQSGTSEFSFDSNTITGNAMSTDGDGKRKATPWGGIYIDITDAGMEDFTFTSNTISNNNGSGFWLDNEGGYADNFSFSLNNINNNADLGLYFGGSSTYDIDLGGGAMGSLGYNTIQGNLGEYDLVNETDETIYAVGNLLNPSRIWGDVIY